MKIVVPYVNLNPRTRAAVAREAGNGDTVIWADTSGSESAYYQLLMKLWAERETFVNLEQDKIPAPGALRAIFDCPEPWCTYPHYANQGEWVAEQPTLGCTKFAAELMIDWPDLIERSGRLNMGFGSGNWGRLDMAITAGLLWAVGSCHVHEFGLLDHDHEGESISVPTRPTNRPSPFGT